MEKFAWPDAMLDGEAIAAIIQGKSATSVTKGSLSKLNKVVLDLATVTRAKYHDQTSRKRLVG
jgi:hypothetical protein